MKFYIQWMVTYHLLAKRYVRRTRNGNGNDYVNVD